MEIKGTATQTLHQSNVTEDCVSERRLWTAVVARALEDWRTGTLRERRKAQQFIFDDHENFERACFFAGLDRESLRSRLLKIGQKVEMESSGFYKTNYPATFAAKVSTTEMFFSSSGGK